MGTENTEQSKEDPDTTSVWDAGKPSNQKKDDEDERKRWDEGKAGPPKPPGK